VFDWDGTLIDSPGTIAECIQQASADLGLEIPDRERASHVIGLGLHDSLRLAVPDLPAVRYGEFAARYREHFIAREDRMRLFPGIEELLARLPRTHTLAIATGKSRKGLDRALQAGGLGRYFAASRCADESRPKPHPAMLLELLGQLKLEAAEALMIGDTSHDLEMAATAGVDAVAVTYGAHGEPGLRACGPRGCVSSVDELSQWLTRNA
jgi:phosphoglycolate phosphatase